MMNIHVNALRCELNWLDRIIEYRHNRMMDRLKKTNHFDNLDSPFVNPACCSPQELSAESSYSEFLRAFNLTLEERLLVALAMAVHIEPHFFTKRETVLDSLDQDQGAVSLGAGLLKGVRYNGLVPSGHTYLLLAGGNNLESRSEAVRYLSSERTLFRNKVLRLEPAQDSDPIYLGKLILAHAYFEVFIGTRMHNFKLQTNE